MFGDPGDRDVLVGDEVTDVGPHRGPVTGWCGHPRREPGGRVGPARTPASTGNVFNTGQLDGWDVEDLPGTLTNQRCGPVEAVTAAGAHLRFVGDHPVRGVTATQMFARITGLFAGLAPGADTPRFRGRLRVALRRRRVRGVPRVHPRFCLQLGDLDHQLVDQLRLFGDRCLQVGDNLPRVYGHTRRSTPPRAHSGGSSRGARDPCHTNESDT